MPFVYHHDGKRFVFASDVKGVLAYLESPKLNEPMLAAYLQMRTYHAEKRFTFFEGIVKLPPAHTLTVTASGAQLSRYWRPEDAPTIRLASSGDYTVQLCALFQQAVECRVRSAFPVGAHLSGGLDSSAIAVVTARALRTQGKRLSTFSWSPAPESGAIADPASEHSRIAAVCQQEGLACEFLPVRKEDYFESFQQDITTEPTEMLAREGRVQTRAKELGLRVMLSGWGGDEAVSARSSAYDLELPGDFGSGASLRKRIGMLRRRLPDALYALGGGNIWLEFESPCIREEIAEKYRREVKELRGPAWRLHPDFRVNMCNRLEYGHLTRRLEHWAVSGARHGLVYRYPMLDRRLVEFAVGGIGREQVLFSGAVQGLLPGGGDWSEAKSEPAALSALKEVYIQAHSEWAALPRNSEKTRHRQLSDLGRIHSAIYRADETRSIAMLAGVREGLACFVIGR